MIKKICVAGAGTMGSGIALASAQQQFDVVLFDTNEKVLDNAKASVKNNLSFLSSKNKISLAEAESIFDSIQFTSNYNDCNANIVIEAIIENLSIKKDLFAKLDSINSPKTIFVSNTSSLSITQLQQDIPNPERVAGLHFFNPAHIMKLVEVVAGKHTSTETIEELTNFCVALKKQAVICKDAPGFIVNRVARHYYLEAMHLASNDNISLEDIDVLMENAGFKMGPFKLMDLIGMDINFAVSNSVYEAFDKHPRFKPSPMQEALVAANHLGKKTGKGFYDYAEKLAK